MIVCLLQVVEKSILFLNGSRSASERRGTCRGLRIMKITPKSPPQAIKMGVKSDSKRPFGGVGSIWRGELVFWYEKIRTQKWKVDFHRPNPFLALLRRYDVRILRFSHNYIKIYYFLSKITKTSKLALKITSYHKFPPDPKISGPLNQGGGTGQGVTGTRHPDST